MPGFDPVSGQPIHSGLPGQELEMVRQNNLLMEGLRRAYDDWTNYIRNFSEIAITDVDGQQLTVLARPLGFQDAVTGDCTALVLSLDSANGKLYCSPGIVSGTIASGSSYTGIPTMDGDLLTEDDPPPDLNVTTSGGVYFKVTWEPTGVEDSNGDWFASGGAIEDVEVVFETSTPTNTAAEVNVATGAATTNGIFYWLAGVVEGTGIDVTLATAKCGHRDVIICGDSDVRLIWSGP